MKTPDSGPGKKIQSHDYKLHTELGNMSVNLFLDSFKCASCPLTLLILHLKYFPIPQNFQTAASEDQKPCTTGTD